MPGPPSEWSDESLLRYLDAIQARLDERWAGHIHWSESQFGNLSHRMDQMEDRLNNVIGRMNELEGSRIGMRTGWAVLVAAIASTSALFLIIDFFTSH